MTRLSRYALALSILLPLAAVMSGCSDASKKQEKSTESSQNDSTEMKPGAGAPESLPRSSDASPPETEAPASAEPPQEDGSTDRGAREVEGPQFNGRAATSPPRHYERLPPSSGSEPPPQEAAGGAAPPPSPLPQEPAGGAAPPPPPPPPAAAPAPAAPPPPPAASAPPPPTLPSTADKQAAGDKVYDVVPVFYGTDRAVVEDPKRLRFGPERAHRLQLGRALVTVPLAHKVPQIERPWVIEIPYFKVKVYEQAEDPAQHFTLQELKSMTKTEMLAFVKERLAKSSAFKNHAIVFVHGFNTSFDYALYRTAQIAYDLKFDGAPFVYSWPSGGGVASYTYDRGSAEQAEPHLAEFLDIVVKESGATSISLIAHSMGNEVLLRVLERMRLKPPKGVEISQIILAAPDVDRDKFDNIAREITGFAKGVTLYAASNDRALRYSASFWGGIPRAGDVPASGPLIVPGVDTIDVSAVSTDSLGLNHSGYAENNALLADIKLLIQTGQRPPDKRIPILQSMKTQAGGAYWRYPPAK